MMFSMVAIVNTMDLESIFSKHTPPLLNDSSLVFLTTARIYAKLEHIFYHYSREDSVLFCRKKKEI